jgi:hypothetical protein
LEFVAKYFAEFPGRNTLVSCRFAAVIKSPLIKSAPADQTLTDLFACDVIANAAKSDASRSPIAK